MAIKNLTAEEAAFLIGLFTLGFGLYTWSGAGLLLIIGVLILVTAPDDE